MELSRKLAWSVLALGVHLAGCAGNGEGLDGNGRPLGSGGGDGGTLTPDLASIQANVFTPICAQCHVGASAPQGLRLDAANSYGALVGVPSSERPSVLRVKPGDAANSYLVQKIEGRAAVGARMPLGQPALPDATILVIRQWIDSGASRGVVTAATKTLAVETVSTAPDAVAVAMSRPVDAALINATIVSLERIDAAGNSRASIEFAATVSPVNDALILVRPHQVLARGNYRLTLRGTEPAAIADWNGVAMDGNNDGAAGGDYVENFIVGDTP